LPPTDNVQLGRASYHILKPLKDLCATIALVMFIDLSIAKSHARNYRVETGGDLRPSNKSEDPIFPVYSNYQVYTFESRPWLPEFKGHLVITFHPKYTTSVSRHLLNLQMAKKMGDSQKLFSTLTLQAE
jgi:hypothetical protein